MKSILTKLRKMIKKEYVGIDAFVFFFFSSLLTFPSPLSSRTFSRWSCLLSLRRSCFTSVFVSSGTVYQGKSCQESLLRKRKVNVVVLVLVFVIFFHRPRFLLQRRLASKPIVPSAFYFSSSSRVCSRYKK